MSLQPKAPLGEPSYGMSRAMMRISTVLQELQISTIAAGVNSKSAGDIVASARKQINDAMTAARAKAP